MAPGRASRTLVIASSGLHPELDQQPTGDGSRPSQTALAVDQHVEPGADHLAQLRSHHLPGVLERLSRHAHVGDRQVAPGHVALAHCLAQPFDPQRLQFVLLDQGHHRRRIPLRDGRHIDRQIAVPRPGQCRRLLLAGAEGQADLAEAFAGRDLGDCKRMGEAGAQAAAPWDQVFTVRHRCGRGATTIW